MTNKEIKKMCEAEQLKQGGPNYPKYKFKITQNKTSVKIYWEYLDGECWKIDKATLLVADEHGNLIILYFDFDSTLEEVIKSSVYYMVTRY